MSRWRAVVFDLDDTLYPERDYVRSGFAAVAAWVSESSGESQPSVFDELWAMFEAGVRHDTFDRWLEQRGRAGSESAAMIEVYRRHRPRLSPYADVVPTLDRLRGKARLGLITEGFRMVQEAKLDALGLRPRFDKIVLLGEDERTDWKPSRGPFDRWLAGDGIAPEEAVYIGDNPAKDFLGARRAGWRSIRIRREDGLHRDEEPALGEGRPDREAADLRSLPSILESFEAESP
jgi:putative hydrolase of the HAD superfamily